MSNNSVLQPWVMECPWKQQSILFSSLRGPDQDYLKAIKKVSRWMRSVSQQNADPSKPYMAAGDLPKPEELDKELEHCTVHFVHHFADGLAVIAHNHPDKEVAYYAANLHFHIAEELFHFIPELRSTFVMRHRDKKDGVDEHGFAWAKHQATVRNYWMAAVMSRFNPTQPPPGKPMMWRQTEPGGPVETLPLQPAAEAI